MASVRGSEQLGSGILRPASGRQLGEVRKSFDKRKWSARFKFKRQEGCLSIDGPTRSCRAHAEADRESIAATMSQAARWSRVGAASGAIEHLRDGMDPTPGSASAMHGIDADKLALMNRDQLRSLANQTQGMQRNKMNGKNKWTPKTCKELKKDFLALKMDVSSRVLTTSTRIQAQGSSAGDAQALPSRTRTQAQALPGRTRTQAQALPGRTRTQASRVLKRPTTKMG